MLIENLDLGDMQHLCDVANDFDADVMLSLLRSCDIPCLKRYGGFASAAKVICGSSNLGVKIYVPSAKLEEATEIINAPFDEEEFERAAMSDYNEVPHEEG